jgi:hypothetical protein
LVDLVTGAVILGVALGVIAMVKALLPSIRLEGTRQNLIGLEYIAVGLIFSAFLLEELLSVSERIFSAWRTSKKHSSESLGWKALILLLTLVGSLGIVIAAEVLPGSGSAFHQALTSRRESQLEDLRAQVSRLSELLKEREGAAISLRERESLNLPGEGEVKQILKEAERRIRELRDDLAKTTRRLASLEHARQDTEAE